MFLLLILNTTYNQLRRCYPWEMYNVRSLRMAAAMIWLLFIAIVLILYVSEAVPPFQLQNSFNCDLSVLILQPKSSETC